MASGGVEDGQGVATALVLGAESAVMGTGHLGSEKVIIHPNDHPAALEAVDDGQVTSRSKVFNRLRGRKIWPEGYDRA